jgi:hypothetical protein
MGLTMLLSLLLSVQYVTQVSASWRQEHFVTGLPTIDGSQLTSYAGLVPVRKDDETGIEVLPHADSLTALERPFLLVIRSRTTERRTPSASTLGSRRPRLVKRRWPLLRG